jgi:hypothetical protein
VEVNLIEKSKDIIKKVVDHYKWPIGETIFIEGLRNFGDCLHVSMIVNHYRKVYPKSHIIWAISEKYFEQFETYTVGIPCVIFPLPHDLTPGDRQEIKKWSSGLGFFKTIFPCVAVSGWTQSGNIIDNMLFNADIKELKVPRKPVFPHEITDYQWHDQFIIKNKLLNRPYIALEYNSYTLSKPPHNVTWSVDIYNKMLSKFIIPVIYMGSASDPKLNYGFDARGCTWRQAKIIIQRARAMIGCGSGLSVLSACGDIKTPLVEINIGDPLSMKSCYGKQSAQSIHTEKYEQITSKISEYF